MDYSLLTKKIPAIFDNKDAAFQIVLDQDEIAVWQNDQKKELKKLDLPEDWAEIGVILEDKYILVLRDLVEFPGGYRNGYLRIFNREGLENGASGVVVLPEKDGKFLIMRQFRHATRNWHWEIPRGFGESGLSPEENAAKEVSEEIHGKIGELLKLGSYHNNTGLEGHTVQLFMAKMNSVGEGEKTEGIKSIRWVSSDEIEEMISNEEITDGFTIAAYTRAKFKGLI